MKRFNFRFWAKPHRVYCDNGEFVDAEIAAELLEALEDLLYQAEKEQGEFYWWIDLEQARAAIAKAKGETNE